MHWKTRRWVRSRSQYRVYSNQFCMVAFISMNYLSIPLDHVHTWTARTHSLRVNMQHREVWKHNLRIRMDRHHLRWVHVMHANLRKIIHELRPPLPREMWALSPSIDFNSIVIGSRFGSCGLELISEWNYVEPPLFDESSLNMPALHQRVTAPRFCTCCPSPPSRILRIFCTTVGDDSILRTIDLFFQGLYGSSGRG